MKTFPFILSLILSYFLQETNGQDMNERFQDFLINSLASLPTWMKENGYVPDPLQIGISDEFIVNSVTSGHPFLDLAGEFKERFYHGADKNIRFLELSSNISSLSFKMDLAFGDGENDFVEGKYYLDGTILHTFPVRGNGKFTRTNLTGNPLHSDRTCSLEVTPNGFFQFSSCWGGFYSVRFANLSLEGFGETLVENDINDMVNSWYKIQISDFPNTDSYWFEYMSDIFEVTPIVDIIGVTLPPTITASSKKSRKSPVYTKKPYFDMEKKELIQKVIITF